MNNKTNISFMIPNWLDKICAWPVLLYRKIRYKHSFRRISLGQGLFTKVDPEDYYRFNYFNWCIRETETTMYAVRLVKGPENRAKIISLHREILNAPSHLLVDHRNSDGFDNLKYNLRLATRSQNQFNRRKTKSKTSSRFVGVYYSTRKNRWMANIHLHRKRIWLGSFKSEIDAARAYDIAAIKYHGEFAKLNFPKRSPAPRNLKDFRDLVLEIALQFLRVVFHQKNLPGSFA